MTKIMITAAGKGTRLLPFTKEIDVGTENLLEIHRKLLLGRHN